MSLSQISTKTKAASHSPAAESFTIEDPEAIKDIVESAARTPGSKTIARTVEVENLDLLGLPAALIEVAKIRGLTTWPRYERLGVYSTDDGTVDVLCEYDMSRHAKPRLSSILEIHYEKVMKDPTTPTTKIRMILLPTPYAGGPSSGQPSSSIDCSPAPKPPSSVRPLSSMPAVRYFAPSGGRHALPRKDSDESADVLKCFMAVGRTPGEKKWLFSACMESKAFRAGFALLYESEKEACLAKIHEIENRDEPLRPEDIEELRKAIAYLEPADRVALANRIEGRLVDEGRPAPDEDLSWELWELVADLRRGGDVPVVRHRWK